MIELQETNDGGDYVVNDSDILLDNSLNTTGYVSHFGGNLKENTDVGRKPPGVKYNDYWGNCDNINNPEKQFNSDLERVLSKVPLRSGGLSSFEQAGESDLNFLILNGQASKVQSTASIQNPGVLKIDEDVYQPSQSEPESFTIFWDETLQRLTV